MNIGDFQSILKLAVYFSINTFEFTYTGTNMKLIEINPFKKPLNEDLIDEPIEVQPLTNTGRSKELTQAEVDEIVAQILSQAMEILLSKKSRLEPVSNEQNARFTKERDLRNKSHLRDELNHRLKKHG